MRHLTFCFPDTKRSLVYGAWTVGVFSGVGYLLGHVVKIGKMKTAGLFAIFALASLALEKLAKEFARRGYLSHAAVPYLCLGADLAFGITMLATGIFSGPVAIFFAAYVTGERLFQGSSF